MSLICCQSIFPLSSVFFFFDLLSGEDTAYYVPLCITFAATPFHAMTVSAVDQLQVMASKRQYKEAAAQLEVTYFSIW